MHFTLRKIKMIAILIALFQFAFTETIGSSMILNNSFKNLRHLEDSNTHTMMINFDNYEIPSNLTTYVCKYFKLHDLIKEQTGLSPDAEYHLTGYEIVQGNLHVHHMMVYSCDDTVEFNENYESCERMYPSCHDILAFAGDASPSVQYPKEVGTPWGGKTKVVRLRIRYDLTQRKDGEKDSSGFKITFTDKLRPNNLGEGRVEYPEEKISLPAHQEKIEIEETCPSSCSDQLEEKGFDILWVVLQGHKLLKSGSFDIIYKNGTIDSSIVRVDDYDYYNKFVKFFLDKPLHISPGDSLRTVCAFDTTPRNTTTLGGKMEDDERCLAIIGYFPAENGIKYCGGGICSI